MTSCYWNIVDTEENEYFLFGGIYLFGGISHLFVVWAEIETFQSSLV